MLEPHFALNLSGKANLKSVIQGDTWRFTVLTPAMLRIEQSLTGKFEDAPTQIAWNRDFPVPEFTLTETETSIEIDTVYYHLFFRKGPITNDSLYIDVRGNYSNYFARWNFGDEPRDLRGTCRTLDKIDGPCELERGLCSFNGWSWFDDSHSLRMTPDGWIEPRENADNIDCYYMGYMRDYRTCIADFYRLTSPPPMLPRYALGNWWCRFYPYSQEEFLGLFDRFKQEEIPFSVAILDLYWHLTKIPEKYGRAWGGYTWDRELYPDPDGLLNELHNRGLAVSMNEHPNVGIRQYEDIHPKMCEDLGVDPGNPVLFDPASPEFFTAYFKNIFRPLRKMGLDFVWIDWQQANHCELPGLDPLWILNHLHSRELLMDGKRPMLLSRYAGLGSHRYPVGFSGDTFVTWESLRFQPYFTANSANVGFNWWSHDIGGHMRGYHDEELFARWVQLGVFSPIMRMHSNNKIFIFKEPFNYSVPVKDITAEFMRIRHMLVPYLYTMNYRTETELRQLIEPMYFSDPDDRMAYDVPNEYWFGDQLIACPITDPMEADVRKAGVRVWLPKGLWTDIFTGQVYEGNRMIKMYRGLDTFPVLAKEGGILPLAAKTGENGVENPVRLDIRVFPGADGSFTLYEDMGDGFAYRGGKCAKTTFTLSWNDSAVFTIAPPAGDRSLIPSNRLYTVRFCGFKEPHAVTVEQGGKTVAGTFRYEKKTACLKLELPQLSLDEAIIIQLTGAEADLWDFDQKLEKLYDLLLPAKVEYELKERAFAVAKGAYSAADALARIQGIGEWRYEATIQNERSLGHPNRPYTTLSREMLEAISEIMG